jgi:hypothetical protein
MSKNNSRNASAKRLVLNKETLRQLNPNELVRIRGRGDVEVIPTPDCSRIGDDVFA